MAVQPTSGKQVELSEANMEKHVGDITYRLRRAEKIRTMNVNETLRYGPLRVTRREREWTVYDIDGVAMEPIPSSDFDANSLAALLDHKLETAFNAL